MALTVGTYDISMLLDARFQSVAQFDMDTIQAILERDVAAHNQNVEIMVGEFCDLSTDRQRIYGTSAEGEMIPADEYTRGPGQRIKTGATVGFPLELYQYNIGMTYKFWQRAKPRDIAIRVLGAEKAHKRAIIRELKRAIYLSSNYTWADTLIDNVDLSVKRFINADGSSIPEGPNGETFDGDTHTHFLARAGGSLATTDVDALIEHVVEHGHGTKIMIAIARADENTFRALNGFKAYEDPRLILGTSSDHTRTREDITVLNNRPIGLYGAAEIWVKSWAIAGYAVCWDVDAPQKPLVFRQAEIETLQGLRIAAEVEAFPLRAEFMEAEFGIGVWNRTSGAVLYFGDTSYADPVIS